MTDDLAETIAAAAAVERDSASHTAVAHIPSRIGLHLFSAVGNLLDTALGGAFLAPGNGGDVAGTVVLRPDQSEADAVRQLNAAGRRLGRKPIKPGPEDEASEEPVPDEPMTLNAIRHHPDGGLEFGIGGPVEVARAMAEQLLAAFIPALDETGAVNYLSWDLGDPDTGERYSVIVVKPDGLTPHEARQAADRECARLRTLLAEHGIQAD